VRDLEAKTIRRMIEIYCWKKHRRAKGELCSECSSLLEYALERLEHCPFGENKHTCRRCPVHCYKPSMRSKVKEVMRFSGPRLLLHHPLLWLAHELKERLGARTGGVKVKGS